MIYTSGYWDVHLAQLVIEKYANTPVSHMHVTSSYELFLLEA